MPTPSSVRLSTPPSLLMPTPLYFGKASHICFFLIFLLSVIKHKIKRILFAVDQAPALEGVEGVGGGGGWL